MQKNLLPHSRRSEKEGIPNIFFLKTTNLFLPHGGIKLIIFYSYTRKHYLPKVFLFLATNALIVSTLKAVR